MSNVDRQYLTHLQKLYKNFFDPKHHIMGRNGGTTSIFGHQMRFNLEEEFPILLSKSVHFKSIMVELLWFLKGHSNIAYLKQHGVKIWDEWADADGELGPVYGVQWRKWKVDGDNFDYRSDQITNVMQQISNSPHGRRHIVTAWNPAEVDNMALPPCHTMFQFYVDGNKKLSCHLYQRSADWFLGVPFNIASYALLTILMARELKLGVGDFVHSFGDSHLYDNHREQAAEQILRLTDVWNRENTAKVVINSDRSLFDLEPEDITLENYAPMSKISAPVSV